MSTVTSSQFKAPTKTAYILILIDNRKQGKAYALYALMVYNDKLGEA